MASWYEKRYSNCNNGSYSNNGSLNSTHAVCGSDSFTLADREMSPVLFGVSTNSTNNNNKVDHAKKKVDTCLLDDDEDEVFVRRIDQAPFNKRRGGSRGFSRGLTDDSEYLLHPDAYDSDSDKLNEADYAFSRSHANRVRSVWQSRARRSVCTCAFMLIVFGALIAGAIYMLKQFGKTESVSTLDIPTARPEPEAEVTHGCDSLRVDDVWSVGFAKLQTSSAFRLLDANHDDVLDIVFGYSTAAVGDAEDSEPLLCAIYFNGTSLCFGGVRCLDGRDGHVLWDTPAEHEIHALNCAKDIDGDKVPDCIAAGRGSVLMAVSGRSGAVIWRFSKPESQDELVRLSNMHTAAFVGDVDQDGVLDIAQLHGGEPRSLGAAAALLLVSGRTGRLLRSVSVPDHAGANNSPELLALDDGLPALIYGTGSETQGGSLWRVKLADLLDGRAEQRSQRLASDPFKGWMAPCAFADVTMDNVVDLLCVAFNASVHAIDGRTWRTVWTFSEPLGESYATPAVGYFNDDDVPDLAVQFNIGDGFPVYYYSVTLLLDGRTGRPLPNFRRFYSLAAAHASPLTISFDGRGNDLLLFWSVTCSSVTSQGQFTFDAATAVANQDGIFANLTSDAMRGAFLDGHRMQFLRDTESDVQNRADLCSQRFDNVRQRSFAWVSGASLRDARSLVYDQAMRDANEHSAMLDTHAELRSWLQRNPRYEYYYKQYASEVRRLQELDTDEADSSELELHSASNSKPRKLDSSTNRHRNRRAPNDNLKRIGIQHVAATGTLAPRLFNTDNTSNSSIDYVFATYWSPSRRATLLFADEQRCIDELLAQESTLRFKAQFNGMDHDRFIRAIARRCLEQSKHSANRAEKLQFDATNPFELNAGQLTVYRVRLTCNCQSSRCARILPFEQQRWAAYLGLRADGVFQQSTGPARSRDVLLDSGKHQ